MNKLNPSKVALATGLLLGGFHLAWSILIALGVAQPILDFIFSLHMISPYINVLPFDFGTMIELVAFTFTVGCVLGYIGALVWNMVHKK